MDFKTMTEAERFKHFRKSILGINQTSLGLSVGLSQTAIGQMENGVRSVTDRTYMFLSDKYNLNVDWLKTGIGEPTVEPDVFSLDEYAKQRNMRDEELDVVKFYLSLEPEIRDTIIDRFKAYFGIGSGGGKDLIKEDMDDFRTENEMTRSELDRLQPTSEELEALAAEHDTKSGGKRVV